MRSALYTGRVSHRRLEPRPHAFDYRLFLLYLDLGELPELARQGLLATGRWPAPVRFRRADYLGPTELPLEEAVRARVADVLGRRPAGAVRLLTQPRVLGYLFNPVSFYYCFDRDEALDAVVAEITNTPWNERHAYVLDAREGQARWRFAKTFHVSPFLPLELDYEWHLEAPGERLAVHMTDLARGRPVFHAGLTLKRRALTRRALAGCLLRHPLQPLRLHAAIYWQAARLALRRAPFHVHPSKRVPRPAKRVHDTQPTP